MGTIKGLVAESYDAKLRFTDRQTTMSTQQLALIPIQLPVIAKNRKSQKNNRVFLLSIYLMFENTDHLFELIWTFV